MLRNVDVFVMLGAVTEGGQRHIAFLCGGDAGNFTCLPFLICGVKPIRQWFGWPAEAYAFGFGGGNAFSLTLAYVNALIFRNKTEHLQNNVA